MDIPLIAQATEIDTGDTAWMLAATALVLMMTLAVALISGAVVERMRFGAFLVFAAVWSVAVYAVLAHWSFGGGWLFERGTLDFAGGVPVEMGSGFSALAAALVVGARKDYGRQALLPHNAVYVLLGAGLLWFGWFGFNGGSGFGTGEASVLAFTNTLLCPAASLLAWFALDAVRGRKVTAIGAATAIIVGCVLITPAGGYVSPGWAMALGAAGAIPCYALVAYRPRTRVDETLDVLAVHGLAGFIGILFIGFFAQEAWNGISDGAIYGNGSQLGDQALAALAAPVYAFVATFVLLKVIGALIPLRASEREEALGLDVVYHGEEAYPTGEGAILVSTEARVEEPVPVRQPG
jgi:Amt family ammonium transporter